MDDFFEKSVCCLYMYVMFYVCVETNFVDFEQFCSLMTFVRNSREMD